MLVAQHNFVEHIFMYILLHSGCNVLQKTPFSSQQNSFYIPFYAMTTLITVKHI